MKFSMILALPVLAMAAATPAAPVVEERQLPITLPPLPLNLDCVLRIAGITACVPTGLNPGLLLSQLTTCPLGVVISALSCVTAGLPGLPPLPVKA